MSAVYQPPPISLFLSQCLVLWLSCENGNKIDKPWFKGAAYKVIFSASLLLEPTNGRKSYTPDIAIMPLNKPFNKMNQKLRIECVRSHTCMFVHTWGHVPSCTATFSPCLFNCHLWSYFRQRYASTNQLFASWPLIDHRLSDHTGTHPLNVKSVCYVWCHVHVHVHDQHKH